MLFAPSAGTSSYLIVDGSLRYAEGLDGLLNNQGLEYLNESTGMQFENVNLLRTGYEIHSAQVTGSKIPGQFAYEIAPSLFAGTPYFFKNTRCPTVNSVLRGGAPNSAVRSGSGHGYAADVLEGGTGRAFAGHGELRYGAGDLIVPQGTSITMPRMGHRIQDVTGRLMEQGDWNALAALAKTNPKVADDLIGMSTHLPGAKIPNFTLKAPKDLTIMSASKTVEDATPLQVLIKDAQGNWSWAACTKYRR